MSNAALDVAFEREAFSVDEGEEDKYASRWAACPAPRSGAQRFLIGCCFPFAWMCWYPTGGSASKGGLLMCCSLIVIILGALFYWGVEGAAECEALGIPFGQQTKWTYGNSIYFMFIALATIGFGDYYPSTSGGKVFFIFHSAIGVAVIAASLGYFASSVVTRLESEKEAATKRARKLGCSESVAKKYIKNRVWIYVAATYVFLLLIGGVLFGFGNPFNAPKYLNGVYFTVSAY
jgi:hypothetical protein